MLSILILCLVIVFQSHWHVVHVAIGTAYIIIRLRQDFSTGIILFKIAKNFCRLYGIFLFDKHFVVNLYRQQSDIPFIRFGEMFAGMPHGIQPDRGCLRVIITKIVYDNKFLGKRQGIVTRIEDKY